MTPSDVPIRGSYGGGIPTPAGADGADGDGAENIGVATPDRYVGRYLDRATLIGIGVGLALLLQPWWEKGFRVGFFVTLGATVAQVVASHLAARHR